MTPILELRGVTKRFGDFVAVDNLDLTVAPGEFLTLLGASGSGKTTTLRMIAGFEHPEAGDILMDGSPVTGLPPYRRDLNTVFQQYALFPHMTVAQNVAFPLKMAGRTPDEIGRNVKEALAEGPANLEQAVEGVARTMRAAASGKGGSSAR